MPTVITHGFVAIVVGKIFKIYPKDKNITFKFWFFSVVCSILPDIDIIPMSFGVPYAHTFGHRGFTHSIMFVVIVAVLVVLLGFKEIKRYSKQWWLLSGYFSFLGLTHICLDTMTRGGLGVGLFIPFDSTRFFFMYRPLRVSPFSFVRFFGTDGLQIIINEFIWVWIPILVILTLFEMIRKLRKQKIKEKI